ncbi:hypothetical protein NL676_024765 [Syzygium grande]|nr:hypothetical protein NL676_024765 [Syzygium grande]
MFAHFVLNFPAFQQMLIFVTIQFLMIQRVQDEERFLVGRGWPTRRVCIYPCIVRYGYRGARDSYSFEMRLMREVMQFLKSEYECHEERIGAPTFFTCLRCIQAQGGGFGVSTTNEDGPRSAKHEQRARFGESCRSLVSSWLPRPSSGLGWFRLGRRSDDRPSVTVGRSGQRVHRRDGVGPRLSGPSPGFGRPRSVAGHHGGDDDRRRPVAAARPREASPQAPVAGARAD